jgi:hypothetical protein
MTRKNRFSLNLVSIVTVAVAGVWISALIGQADEVIHVLGGIYLKGWKIATAIGSTVVVWNVALQYFVRRGPAKEERLDIVTESEPEHMPLKSQPTEVYPHIQDGQTVEEPQALSLDLEDPFPACQAPARTLPVYTADEDPPETLIGLGPVVPLDAVIDSEQTQVGLGPAMSDEQRAELQSAIEGEDLTDPHYELPSSFPPPPETEEDITSAPTLRDGQLTDALAAFMDSDPDIAERVNARSLSDEPVEIEADPDPEAVLLRIVARCERAKSAVA